MERVQKTMKEEFWSAVDLNKKELATELGVWVTYYNYQRVHGSISMTPIEKFCSKIWDVPEDNEIENNYDNEKEYFRMKEYKLDIELRKIKKN